MYLYILGIRHYEPNRFSALPNFWKRWILANIICESQFSRSLVNLCENAGKCYEYSVFTYSRPFSENRRMCGSALKQNSPEMRKVYSECFVFRGVFHKNTREMRKVYSQPKEMLQKVYENAFACFHICIGNDDHHLTNIILK